MEIRLTRCNTCPHLEWQSWQKMAKSRIFEETVHKICIFDDQKMALLVAKFFRACSDYDLDLTHYLNDFGDLI